VIRVRMGEEHRVNARKSMRERLLPQIGRRVDENPRTFGHVNINRRSQASIAWIGRTARRARAADHRDPVRRPGAQHRDRALDLRQRYGVMMRDCGLPTSTYRRRSSYRICSSSCRSSTDRLPRVFASSSARMSIIC
jgi:hypothetical protein